jgi:hypothetical protein
MSLMPGDLASETGAIISATSATASGSAAISERLFVDTTFVETIVGEFVAEIVEGALFVSDALS